MRGAGTSLAGQTCNDAVLIDISKHMNSILAFNPGQRLLRRARLHPRSLCATREEEHQLTFGPDPATHDHNTLGGMLGNNSCGVHSVMAGRTSDNVQSMRHTNL